jgi:hypothetical protein
MADIPVPRSYQQTLGTMIAAFLARYPIDKLKVGGPILSILEAAAQSDVRGSADIFNMLAAVNLDSAEGEALNKILRDEGSEKLGATPASGLVTIGDGRYTKQASVVYQGKPAPLAGTNTIYVANASSWAGTGYVYIGRGTSNYEGPLQYISTTPPGGGNNYWTITLHNSSRTTRYHNLGETVIVAQGGDRPIAAGTTVQTALGNASEPIAYRTLYSAVLPDGEVALSGVRVICSKPGTIGNAVAGSINSFTSAPFTGATATNPLPFVNGDEAETDPEVRDRVRLLRKAKTKGTKAACEAFLLGVVSEDENKRISSVSVLERKNDTTTAYIDDGTGYEESTASVPYEILTNSAVGGEEYFQLSLGRPVAKAFLQTTTSQPWDMSSSPKLSVRVGDILTEHTFSTTDFESPSNASAHEVAHSINADPALLFSARLSDNSRKVSIFAKVEANEDIGVVPTANDANTILYFPIGTTETTRLFKNDVLLSKDGRAASIEGNAQGSWQAAVSGDTLEVRVDGTELITTHTFIDADFVNAGTSYVSVNSSNSLAAWAQVVNYKIPGVTASVTGDSLLLQSNAGAVSRGALEIAGGSLVTKRLFDAGSDTARQSDYTLNRNTGQLQLNELLVAGDKLTVGSPYTRAFLESTKIPGTLNIAGGDTWFAIDGDAQLVELYYNNTTVFTVTAHAAGGYSDQLGLAANSDVFVNVQVGDFVIMWDANLANNGAFRVSNKVSDSDIWLAADAINALGPVSLAEAGIAACRTSSPLQRVTVTTSANWTAVSLAAHFQRYLEGVTCEVIRTGRFRITTDTSGSNGSVMYVAGDAGVSNLPLVKGVLATGEVSHVAYVESANAENSVPSFREIRASSTGSTTAFVAPNSSTDGNKGDIYSGLRHIITNGSAYGYGSNLNFASNISDSVVAGDTTLTLRETSLVSWLLKDRIMQSRPYCLGPTDDLSIVLDNNVSSKRFDVTMARRITPVGDYDGVGMEFKDYDNSGEAIGTAFGSTFSFNDYALYMKARVLTDPATNKEILWRWNKPGPDGNAVSVRYVYPIAPNSVVNWAIDYSSTRSPVVDIVLPSGGETVMANLTTTMRVASQSDGLTGPPTSPYSYFLYTALEISNYSVTGNVATITVRAPAGTGTVTNHGLTAGTVCYAYFNGGETLNSQIATVASPGALTIQYPIVTPDDPGPGVGSHGWLYFDSIGPADWTGALQDEVLWMSPLIGVQSAISNKGLHIVGVVAGTNNTVLNVYSPTGVAAQTTIVHSAAVADVTRIQSFAVGAPAQDIASGLPATAPITGSSLQVGIIAEATWYSSGDVTLSYALLDGINYVQSTYPAASPADYSVDLKYSVSGNLLSYTGWATEEVYLVPTTADNVQSFLGTTATNGLSANGEVKVSSRAGKVQIATATQGKPGIVDVRGGTANSVLAEVQGTGALTGDSLATYVAIPSGQGDGFHGSWYCEIANSIGHVKGFAADTGLLGDLTSIVGSAWTFADPLGLYASEANIDWQVERQGNYMAMVWTGIGVDPTGSLAFSPGDNITISNDGITDTVSVANTGTFTILAIDDTNGVVWFSNPAGVDERSIASFQCSTLGSIMPGDTLNVGHTNWGVANKRSFTVATANVGGFASVFTTVEAPAASGAVVGPQTLVTLRSSTPIRLLKKLTTVVPTSNPDLDVMVFEGTDGSTVIAEGLGSTVVALSKLGFPLGASVGADGYAYSTGLIGEANKVLYGSETDTVTYPGVVAAGSVVNISGPTVRRVQLSLLLRIRNGANRIAVFDAVRNSIATFVNEVKVGQSIAISDLVAVANAINGVESVVVADPTYDISADKISVQPYEKPLVLVPNVDITLTLIN